MDLTLRSYTYMRAFIITAMVFFSLLVIVQTYQIYQNFSLDFLRQSIRTYAICIFGVCMNTLYIILSKIYVNNHAYIDSLSSTITTEIGELTRRKSENLVSKLGRWFNICILGAMLSFAEIFCAWLQTTNSELEIIMSFGRQWISEDLIVEQVLFWGIAVCTFMVVISVITAFFSCVYVIMIITLQMLILIDKVESKFEQNNEMVVMKNIREYSMAHLRIKRFSAIVIEPNQHIFVLYVVLAFIAIMSSLYFIYSPIFNFTDGIVLFVTYVVYIYCCCTFGQHYVDSYTDLTYALYDLKWYSWSTICQKSFLIVFMNISKGDCLNFALMFDVSNDLIKKFARVTYSIANCLYTIKLKNS